MRRIIPIVAAVSALIALSWLTGCESSSATALDNLRVGPNLLSEDETVSLVLRETPLREVESVGLQTCGPIYRVVRGKTENDREIVVWVSDGIVGNAYLDEVTSKQQAIRQTTDTFHGCTIDEAIPIYVPDTAKSHALPDIGAASVNTFWQVIFSYGDESAKSNNFVPMVDIETDLGGPIVARADVGFLHTLYIVQVSAADAGEGDSGDSTPFSGFFDLVVKGNFGTELDRHSLNRYFDGKALSFEATVDLKVSGYESERPHERHVAIGFPADDGTSEYRYVIFTFGVNGLMSTMPAGGYKEDGFVYTAPAGHSIKFTTSLGQGPRSLLVGVERDGGGFEPARYVWSGTKYEFQKDDPFLIPLSDGERTYAEQVTLSTHGRLCSVSVEQTEYKKPLAPGEPGFSMYKSQYCGSFDLVVTDKNGEELSRVSLNEQFGRGDLGSGGSFSVIFQDYNGDGDPDFAIEAPEPDWPEFRNVLFSLNSEGVIRRLPVTGYKEDGFLYRWGHAERFRLLEGDEKGIQISVYEDGGGEKYVWDGSKFVFSK